MCPAGQRREDGRQFLKHILAEGAKQRGFQRAQVIVQRVHDDAERDVTLELGSNEAIKEAVGD